MTKYEERSKGIYGLDQETTGSPQDATNRSDRFIEFNHLEIWNCFNNACNQVMKMPWRNLCCRLTFHQILVGRKTFQLFHLLVPFRYRTDKLAGITIVTYDGSCLFAAARDFMSMRGQDHRLDGWKRTPFKSPLQVCRHLSVSTQNLQSTKVGENLKTASKCGEIIAEQRVRTTFAMLDVTFRRRPES